jgi:hypothetical protein
MNNVPRIGRILGITLLAVTATLCPADFYSNSFDADVMDRHWKLASSGVNAVPARGELEQANGWLFYSAAPGDITIPVNASYVLDGYALRLDADWTIRVQAVVDAGREEHASLPAGAAVRMSIGIRAGAADGSAPYARHSVGISSSDSGTFTEMSSAGRAAGSGRITHAKLGRRRHLADHELTPLVISYNARADTLTMSAGSVTKTIRRFRAQMVRRGFRGDLAVDLSSESVGISGDRIAMFDNFSVRGAVAR